jgi:outer membrane lipoprotein SlyB
MTSGSYQLLDNPTPDAVVRAEPGRGGATTIVQSVRASIAITIASLVIGGCAESLSGDVYSRSAAREVQTVQDGEVLIVREVTIEGQGSGLGAIAGGALGYAVGAAVGGGSGTKIAKVGGATAGAAAGGKAAQKASREKGLEITVELESGEVIVIVQAADETFDPGDRVRVIRRPDGSARVIQ